MGLFSGLFRKSTPKIVSGKNPGSGWVYANRFNKARGGRAGGYGAITFGNIMNAHSDAEEITDVWELDGEGCEFIHPDFGTNCYDKAYQEEYLKAMGIAMMMVALGIPADPEDFIDWDAVYENAYEYACQLAQMYIDGQTWIPKPIIQWAYYDVSGHNG